MSIRFLVSLLVVSLASSTVAKTADPFLVVLLMVKDEAAKIQPTLETYISSDIKYGGEDPEEVAYIVYDTGSTDGTQQLAQELFEKYSIKNYSIAQGPWRGYADSRSDALRAARERYPNSTFILFPDAEWYLHNFEGLISFCQEKMADYETGTIRPPYYHQRMGNEYWSGPTSRLFLTADDVIFEGRIHECPTKTSDQALPDNIWFEVRPSESGAEKSRDRWANKDVNMLLEDHLNDPDNPRPVLYLGFTHKWLGNNERAYEYLKLRTTMPSYPQEDYYALYNLAEVTEELSYEKPKRYTWNEALGYYMQSYAMRPHRAEPLVRIASHYLEENNYGVAYLFAKRACELAMPNYAEEMQPILLHDYSYYRWEVLSRAAWYVQEYEVGEQAAKKAIEGQPNAPHLYKNLSFYWERNAQMKG